LQNFGNRLWHWYLHAQCQTDAANPKMVKSIDFEWADCGDGNTPLGQARRSGFYCSTQAEFLDNAWLPACSVD